MPGYKRYGCPCCRPSSSSASSSSLSSTEDESESASSSASSASTQCCDLLSTELYANIQVQLYPNAVACIRPPNRGVRCFVFKMTEITQTEYESITGHQDCCASDTFNYQRIWHGTFVGSTSAVDDQTSTCLECNDGLGMMDSHQKCLFAGGLIYTCCCNNTTDVATGSCESGAFKHLEAKPAATPIVPGSTTNCCFTMNEQSCSDQVCFIAPDCSTGGHCGSSSMIECYIDNDCCGGVAGCGCNGSLGTACVRIGTWTDRPVSAAPALAAQCDDDTGTCGCAGDDGGGGGGGAGAPIAASAIDARTGRPLIDIFKEMGYV